VKPLFLVTTVICDHNHRVWREGSAMDAAMAERIPVLAGGASIHSNMSKICRKLVRLHVGSRCPVRRLVLGVESEGHRATPSIWRGSRLKWFELAVPGARTSARRGLVGIYRRSGGTKLDPYNRRSQGAFGPIGYREQ
jgi:hypothetical protein